MIIFYTRFFEHDLILHVFDVVLSMLCMFQHVHTRLPVHVSVKHVLFFLFLFCVCFMCVLFENYLSPIWLCMLRMFFACSFSVGFAFALKASSYNQFFVLPVCPRKKCSYTNDRSGNRTCNPRLRGPMPWPLGHGAVETGPIQEMQDLAKRGERDFCYRGARRTAICGARSGMAQGPRALRAPFHKGAGAAEPSLHHVFTKIFLEIVADHSVQRAQLIPVHTCLKLFYKLFRHVCMFFAHRNCIVALVFVHGVFMCCCQTQCICVSFMIFHM